MLTPGARARALGKRRSARGGRPLICYELRIRAWKDAFGEDSPPICASRSHESVGCSASTRVPLTRADEHVVRVSPSRP